MTMQFYLRDGTATSDITAWGREREARFRVALTDLPDGRVVSTIYIGIDHQYGEGPPLIFETMVFPSRGDYEELDCVRYSTEAEAVAGHAAMVETWSAKS